MTITFAAATGLTARQPLRDGLLHHLRRRGTPTPDHVTERITARTPTPREATLLEVGPRDCRQTGWAPRVVKLPNGELRVRRSVLDNWLASLESEAA